MSRTISTLANQAIQDTHVRVAVFIELDLPDGFLRLSNSTANRVWNGHTWLGGGNFTAIQPIEEGVNPQSAALNIVISGIDNTYVQAIMEDHYQGRSAKIWVAPLDTNEQVIANPILVFQGRMDEPSITMGATADITISLENRWADWDRPRLRRYNDSDQQLEYPGDLGFQFVEQMETMELSWGTYKGPTAPKIEIPRWAKEYLINPFITPARQVARVLRRIF
jgi:hypothetical protein